jgi:hypothetical protein
VRSIVPDEKIGALLCWDALPGYPCRGYLMNVEMKRPDLLRWRPFSNPWGTMPAKLLEKVSKMAASMRVLAVERGGLGRAEMDGRVQESVRSGQDGMWVEERFSLFEARFAGGSGMGNQLIIDHHIVEASSAMKVWGEIAWGRGYIVGILPSAASGKIVDCSRDQLKALLARAGSDRDFVSAMISREQALLGPDRAVRPSNTLVGGPDSLVIES